MGRFCEHPINGPSIIQPLTKGIPADAGHLRPIGKRQCLSFVSDFPGRPPIVALLGHCRPATVSRLVIPVVVDAIQGFIRRTRTHIGEELGEVFFPFWADNNTPTAVIGPCIPGRIRTASSHLNPSPKLTTVPCFPGLAMLRISSNDSCRNSLDKQTTTAFSTATPKAGRSNRPKCSTIAFTEPDAIAADMPVRRKSRESSEPLAGKIKGRWHALRIAQ